VTLKVYRITFEASLVFASESDDKEEVRGQVYDALRHGDDMRNALEEADIVGVQRLYANTATEDELESIPYGPDDDTEVKDLLLGQEDPKAKLDLETLKELRAKFQGGVVIDEGEDDGTH
jgi:hypothetical protein